MQYVDFLLRGVVSGLLAAIMFWPAMPCCMSCMSCHDTTMLKELLAELAWPIVVAAVAFKPNKHAAAVDAPALVLLLLCIAAAVAVLQVQYGYINLEEIFRDSTRLSVVDLSSLLLAKIAATSVCVGGGLVGGLFAPSLFIGALVGDIMGHFVANT
jgi:H+/Cl- antiporter ClcA